MAFFIAPSETHFDSIVKSLEQKPGFAERLKIQQELQEPVPEAGPMFKGEWARVASLSLPIDMVARVLEPGFFKDKRVFYKWLDRHPQYSVYDRRAMLSRRPFHGWSFDASTSSAS